jgi:hypothetical protein
MSANSLTPCKPITVSLIISVECTTLSKKSRSGSPFFKKSANARPYQSAHTRRPTSSNGTLAHCFCTQTGRNP